MSYIILDGSAFAEPTAALAHWRAGAVLCTVSDKTPWSIADSELLHRRRFVYIRLADGRFARIIPEWEKTVSQ
jgi:hypothetical protein